MTDAVQYLEAAKIEEVAAKLKAEGYEIIKPTDGPENRYDLIATKAGKTVAVEVKARTKLRDEVTTIKMLHELARERGYDEFRLVVVNPPHEVSIEIEGLKQRLWEYLTNNFPDELDVLSSHTYLEEVTDIDIHSLRISSDGILVTGSGFLEVLLEYDHGEAQDGISVSSGFPFEFEIKLNHKLQLEEAYRIEVDTSEFYE